MSFAFSNRLRSADAGVTSMEVALTFGVFIILVFGVIDFSRYFYSQQELTTLATAAARLGYANSQFMINDSGPPTSWANISTYAPLLDPSQTAINMSLIQGNAVGNGQTVASGVNVLTVTATYNFTPITPGLQGLLGQMTATVYYQF